MLKRTFFLVILFFSMNLQAASTVSFMPANKLYSLCSSQNTVDKAVCEGYIMAVNDAMYAGHLANIFNVCLPPGVSPGQARLVVIKHMEQVPDKLHYIADGVVAESLVTAFPCKEKKGRKGKKSK